MKRILIIDHFSLAPGENGNNRFIYLAKLLVEAGYQVEIVTSDFCHTAKKTRSIAQEHLDALPYTYTMLHEKPYKKNISVQRLISHYLFGRKLRRYLESMSIMPDVVYVAVPSIDVGAAVARYCSKQGIPLIVDIQDLWPEAFKLVLDNPIISRFVYCPMRKRIDSVYKRATALIAVSDTYIQRGAQCRESLDNCETIYLGTDLSVFDGAVRNSRVVKPDDELWVTYVGTLGRSYNVNIVSEALSKIKARDGKRIVFMVLGDGPEKDAFEKHAHAFGVEAKFLGRLPYVEMAGYLAAADIAVNPIVKGAAQSIINKHADYATAGLPVMNTQECPEYRELLDKYRCGYNCFVENVDDVAAALQKLIDNPALCWEMGENSRRMAEELFDRPITYQKIITLIRKCMGN